MRPWVLAASVPIPASQESTLLDHWLTAKLRSPKDAKLPNQRQTTGDLVTKTMVAEAFLKRSKHARTVETPWLAAAHMNAATHRSRSPPAPPGCPRGSCGGALAPAHSRRCYRLGPPRNTSTGKTEYSPGPRATLTRNMAASEEFVKNL